MTAPTSASLPEGMSEADYEAIEAAVTETVRGRWFLAEFARRNRIAETRQLLEAVGRIETAVAAQQGPGPAADPSVRLIMQRIKEISGQLRETADDLRAAGVAARLCEAVDHQARAVGGLLRNAALPPAPPREAAASLPAPGEAFPKAFSSEVDAGSREENASGQELRAFSSEVDAGSREENASGQQLRALKARGEPEVGPHAVDPRLAALSGLDGLSFADKLALFG